MLIVLSLYFLIVWLIFFKFKWVPYTKKWKNRVIGIAVLIAVVVVGLIQALIPSSSNAIVTTNITAIAPRVSGHVTEIYSIHNAELNYGDTLFIIDPRPYQLQVDQLKARLVETEAGVAQIKESYDAARANYNSLNIQLSLSKTRLDQAEQLVKTGAGRAFEVEQYQTEVDRLTSDLLAARANENQASLSLNAIVGDKQAAVAQLLAQLEAAQLDLSFCYVTAPANGVITFFTLREGEFISVGKSIASFIHTDNWFIAGTFKQNSFKNVKVGDEVEISFPSLPAAIFDSTVEGIAMGTGEGQITPSGQLPLISNFRPSNYYAVKFAIPEDYPEDHLKVGLNANVIIYTENAGPIAVLGKVLTRLASWLDYLL